MDTTDRLRWARDWTRLIGRMLRLYNRCAREVAHPSKSSGTGLQRQWSYCVPCVSARNRALVTTWEEWGGQSQHGGTQETREGRYELEARDLSATVCLAGSSQQERCLPRAR